MYTAMVEGESYSLNIRTGMLYDYKTIIKFIIKRSIKLYVNRPEN